MEQQQCCTENQRHGLTYYYFSSLFWMEQQPCCANWELKAKATSWLGLTCYFFFFGKGAALHNLSGEQLQQLISHLCIFCFFWKRTEQQCCSQSFRGAAAAAAFDLNLCIFLRKKQQGQQHIQPAIFNFQGICSSKIVYLICPGFRGNRGKLNENHWYKSTRHGKSQRQFGIESA